VLDVASQRPGFPALLFAVLIAGLPARAAALGVPAAFLPELAHEAERILAHPPDGIADDEARKDLAICLCVALPCVAQIVETCGAVSRRPLLTGAPGSLALLRHLLGTRGATSPYLEIHTHTPLLGGFIRPQGWERCYRLLAELLRRDPNCLGMISGSWFYDPAVAAISPRLAFLSETPLAGGAFRVRVGASAEDYALATAKSDLRRTLAQKGKYVPTKWQLIWPRKALLAWADAHAARSAS